MKVSIAKTNALNENLVIETSIKDASEWEDKVRPIFQALDTRQFELNLRVLTVNKEIGKLNPVEFGHLRDILAGLNNIIVEDPTKVQVEEDASN